MEVKDKIYDLFKNIKNGIYIECGANDGITQSNTLELEKNNNWIGILIEPSIVAYNKCLLNRSEKNIFINTALVDFSFIGDSISGDFDGSLMSSVDGNRRNNSNLNKTRARTLTSILDEYSVNKIDFFSLDVEGYELNVLNGLDFGYYKPTYILIEVYNKDYHVIMDKMNDSGYELMCNLSGFNKNEFPMWDGSHNDYLFKIK